MVNSPLQLVWLSGCPHTCPTTLLSPATESRAKSQKLMLSH